MIDSHGTKGRPNCAYSSGSGWRKLQLDPARREVLPGVELDAADGVDVRRRAQGLAQREHLVLAGEGVVDRHRRGHPDHGLQPEVRRGAEQRIVEEREQVALGIAEDVLEQRTRLRVERRLAVRPREPGQQRRRLVGVGDLALADIQVVRGLGEREGEHHVLAVLEEPVAVDPALLGVLDVVVDDELVHGREQLEVPDVREQVRLHDRELHAARSCTLAGCATRSAMRSTVSSRQIRVDRQAQDPFGGVGGDGKIGAVGGGQRAVHREVGDQRVEVAPRPDVVARGAGR